MKANSQYTGMYLTLLHAHNVINAFTRTQTSTLYSQLIGAQLKQPCITQLSNISTCHQHHQTHNSQSYKKKRKMGTSGSKHWSDFQEVSFDLNRVTQGPMTRLKLIRHTADEHRNKSAPPYSLITVVRACCVDK